MVFKTFYTTYYHNCCVYQFLLQTRATTATFLLLLSVYSVTPLGTKKKPSPSPPSRLFLQIMIHDQRRGHTHVQRIAGT